MLRVRIGRGLLRLGQALSGASVGRTGRALLFLAGINQQEQNESRE